MIGIGHSLDEDAIMYQGYNGSSACELGEDDIDAIERLYPDDFSEVTDITYDTPVQEDIWWTYSFVPTTNGYPHISTKWYYYQEEITKAPPAGVWYHLDGFDGESYCQVKGYYPGIRVALDVTDANGDHDSLVKYISIFESKKGLKDDFKELRRDHSYELQANSPNPFNPSTCISYSLATESKVTLSIFNALGERVRILESALKPKGAYSIVWESKDDRGSQVSAGIYIYRIEAIPTSEKDRNPFIASRKMLLAK
jgi:hypothetical protein